MYWTKVLIIAACCYAGFQEKAMGGDVSHHTQKDDGNTIEIHGRVSVEGCEKFILFTYPYYIPLSKNAFSTDTITVKNGRFSYKKILDSFDHPYFNIRIEPVINGDQRSLFRHIADPLFLAARGDSVTLEYHPTRLHFYGRGSARYNLKVRNYEISDVPPMKGTLNQYVGGKDGYQHLMAMEAFQDSLFNVKMENLQKSNKDLNADEMTILELDEYGNRQLHFLRTLSIVSTVLGEKDSVLINNYIRFFREKYGDYRVYKRTTDLAMYSFSYPMFLFNLAHYRTALERGNFRSFSFDIEKEVFESFADRLSGELRDKVLAIGVFRYYAADNDNQMLSFASKVVEDTYLSRLITETFNRVRIGTANPEFFFHDEKERRVSTSTFKGKITLIDVWYTGCIACAHMSEDLGGFFDSLRSEPRFQVVSISIDKTRERWLASLKKETYTHGVSINLHTNGAGSDHPFFRHYDIISYPRYILIDEDGEVISANILPDKHEVKQAVLEAIGDGLR